MSTQDFQSIVAKAMQLPGRQAMRPVIEKEILHYDIFAALEKNNLLTDLVFQGGTSLRLCWQSNRFSEDLDFAGGKDFSAEKLAAIKEAVETHIGKRYGLTVSVKEPKQLADESTYDNIQVSKWQVSVETAPGRTDLPRQRIKIEIANIPAYTEEVRPVLQNYDFLAGYGANILVRVETLSEIMADKVLAFVASKNIRYRDIWDLAFLTQKGALLDTDLVEQKILDYGTQHYETLLAARIAALPTIIRSKDFHDQMTRFIDSATIENTLAKEGFLSYLDTTLTKIFVTMQASLSQDPNEPSEGEIYRM